MQLREGTQMIVGYAKVSTDGQSPDQQQSAVTTAGASRIFAESALQRS
jgi:DNA invertase Pin-like site-specific DNA recombinase